MMQTLVEPRDYEDGMSRDQDPRPGDFINGYTPLRPAELLMYRLKSRPLSGLRELMRKIRRWLPVVYATNDMEAKRLLALVSSQYGGVSQPFSKPWRISSKRIIRGSSSMHSLAGVSRATMLSRELSLTLAAGGIAFRQLFPCCFVSRAQK